jgi:hypothetical protein
LCILFTPVYFTLLSVLKQTTRGVTVLCKLHVNTPQLVLAGENHLNGAAGQLYIRQSRCIWDGGTLDMWTQVALEDAHAWCSVVSAQHLQQAWWAFMCTLINESLQICKPSYIETHGSLHLTTTKEHAMRGQTLPCMHAVIQFQATTYLICACSGMLSWRLAAACPAVVPAVPCMGGHGSDSERYLPTSSTLQHALVLPRKLPISFTCSLAYCLRQAARDMGEGS